MAAFFTGNSADNKIVVNGSGVFSGLTEDLAVDFSMDLAVDAENDLAVRANTTWAGSTSLRQVAAVGTGADVFASGQE